MNQDLTGSCQCGAITFAVAAPALLTYACFCTSCQKRTGSAFSMGLIIPTDALHVSGELSSWSRTSDDGNTNTRYSCADCGNIIYGVGESSPGLAKLQAGLLDNTRELEPEVYIWARSKQTWVNLPQRARPFDTQPDDPMALLQAAQTYREEA
ncbi:MAG: GFA family protein [Gammaproteobacteria bacterium]|nr:GFA family protein [Gammaproteobacteria bacterium]